MAASKLQALDTYLSPLYKISTISGLFQMLLSARTEFFLSVFLFLFAFRVFAQDSSDTFTPTPDPSDTPTFTSTFTPDPTDTSSYTPTGTASSTPFNTPTPAITMVPVNCSSDNLSGVPSSGSLSIHPSGDFIPLCSGWVIYGDQATNQVVIQNVFTGQVNQTYSLEASPLYLGLDATNGFLYATLNNTSALAQVNLTTGQVNNIALSAPASFLAVGNNGLVFVEAGGGYQPTIQIINGLSGSVVQNISNFGSGGFLAYDNVHNQLFVGAHATEPSEFDQYSFNPTMLTLTKLTGVGTTGFGEDLTVSPDGNHVVFPSGGDQKIYDYSSSALTITNGAWDTSSYPWGARYSPDSKYLLATNTTNFMVFDANTHVLLQSNTTNGSLTRVGFSQGEGVVYALQNTGSASSLFWHTFTRPAPTVGATPAPTPVAFNCTTDNLNGIPTSGSFSVNPGQDFIPLCSGWVIVPDITLNQILVENVTTGQVNRRYQMQASPLNLSLDSVNGYLYATLDGSTFLAQINLVSDAIQYLPSTEPLYEVVVGNNGTVFTEGQNDALFSELNGPSGSAPVSLGKPPISYPGCLAYDKVHDQLFYGASAYTPSNLIRYIYNSANLSLTLQQNVQFQAAIGDLDVSTDGNHLLVVTPFGNDQTPPYNYILNDYSPLNLTTIQGSIGAGGPPACGHFSPNNQLFTASNGTTLSIFQLSNYSPFESYIPGANIIKTKFSTGSSMVFDLRMGPPNTIDWHTLPTPVPTATSTPTVTITNTPIFSFTPTSTATNTATPTASGTPTSTNTPIVCGPGTTLLFNWISMSPIPTPPGGGQGVVVNGKIFFPGGSLQGGTLVYDPASNSWSQLAPMPTSRNGFGAGAINGIIYVAGGQSNYNNVWWPYSTLEAYNPATNTWATLAPMPNYRYVVSAGVLNGQLYVIGGVNTPNTVEAYDPPTNSWIERSSMPTGRWNTATVVINNKLYVAAGVNSGFLNNLEVYDPATDSWSERSPIPTAEWGSMGVSLGGKMVVLGGTSPSVSYSKNVQSYDPGSDTWSNLSPLITGRNYLYGGVIGQQIYAMGGQGPGASNVDEVGAWVCVPYTSTPTPTFTQTSTLTLTSTQSATNSATTTATPDSTDTPTNTGTSTATSTATSTITNTSTPDLTDTPTNSPANTATSSATNTATRTTTATATPSATSSATNTATSTSTPDPTDTPTSTATFTLSNTSTPDPTETPTNTPTSTATSTATNTVTVPPTYTATNSNTPTATNSQTNSPTNTATLTATNTATSTTTNTVTVPPTYTATNSNTPTATNSQTNSPTNTSTLTATSTVTNTPTNTATNSATNTTTNTATNSATSTSTNTPTNTVTNSPTVPPTHTATNTITLTATNSATKSPTPSATYTPTNSPTLTPTKTVALTATKTPTATVSKTSTRTATPTITPTPTKTFTKTFTPTITPTPTKTVTPTYTPAMNTPTKTPTAILTFFPTPFKSIAVSDSASACVTVGQSLSVTAVFGPTNDQNQTDDYSIGFGNGTTIVWGNGCTASYNTGSLSTDKPVTVVQSVAVPATVTSGAYTSLDVVGIQDSTYLCGGSTVIGSVSISICSTGSKLKSFNSLISEGTSTPNESLSHGPQVVAAPNVSRDDQPIRFLLQLASPAQVRITLYTLLGEEIYSNESQAGAGSSQLVWNLQNASGAEVASGLYFYVVEVGEGASPIIKTGKILVLR